jgi:type II secretory pathway pseudopilin PulG
MYVHITHLDRQTRDRQSPPQASTAGMTLVEVIVVMATIAILAGFLLPTLARTKRDAQVAVCLNNLHQISLAAQYHLQDQQHYIRSLGGYMIAREFLCPPIDEVARTNEMLARDLYPYLKPSEVYHCPEDKGEDFRPDGIYYGPTLFHAWGCSYQLNTKPWMDTRHPVEGTLPGKREDWVHDPSKYILVYEPPARPKLKLIGPNVCNLRVVRAQYHFHWHFNQGLSTVNNWQFTYDQQKYLSPILFVDGHAALHDFTRALKDDPTYPTEEMPNWIWYQTVAGH